MRRGRATRFAGVSLLMVVAAACGGGDSGDEMDAKSAATTQVAQQTVGAPSATVSVPPTTTGVANALRKPTQAELRQLPFLIDKLEEDAVAGHYSATSVLGVPCKNPSAEPKYAVKYPSTRTVWQYYNPTTRLYEFFVLWSQLETGDAATAQARMAEIAAAPLNCAGQNLNQDRLDSRAPVKAGDGGYRTVGVSAQSGAYVSDCYVRFGSRIDVFQVRTVSPGDGKAIGALFGSIGCPS